MIPQKYRYFTTRVLERLQGLVANQSTSAKQDEVLTKLDQMIVLLGGGDSESQSPAERDSFGRLRTSQPFTLFDSKKLNSNKALFWDDQEVSGSGTTTTYNTNRASVTLGVADTTAGKRVRQTFQRFNYQPGKSLEIFNTGVMGAAAAGITRRIGYFDDQNGIFFQQTSSGMSVGIRSYVTGSAVDTVIPQASWNTDTMDGSNDENNPSGLLLDPTKVQIFAMDIEWLGVGSVRFSVVINGALYLVHQQNHANIIDSVYMSTPNLPLRYEIENDGTGPAATIEDICTTVISEGGAQQTGITGYVSTGGTHIDASAANTIYAIHGIRLRADSLDSVVRLINVSLLAQTSDDFEWLLIADPTVAGTFTYSNVDGFSIQHALGVAANTITPGSGTILDGGLVNASDNVNIKLDSLYYLGSAIDGTPNTLVLAVRPLGANCDIEGTLTWSETA